jgi:hypothetical protein
VLVVLRTLLIQGKVPTATLKVNQRMEALALEKEVQKDDTTALDDVASSCKQPGLRIWQWSVMPAGCQWGVTAH